jgi:hypothetical protein
MQASFMPRASDPEARASGPTCGCVAKALVNKAYVRATIRPHGQKKDAKLRFSGGVSGRRPADALVGTRTGDDCP